VLANSCMMLDHRGRLMAEAEHIVKSAQSPVKHRGPRPVGLGAEKPPRRLKRLRRKLADSSSDRDE
jgi:hypothetical protein